MAYRFARERGDYSALASGHVLYSAPGYTALPVRLASEVFQRCAARLEGLGVPAPYLLYDPCCGSGQLLVTLAYLHGESLAAVVGSDADAGAVRLAERNLGLLTPAGLAVRTAQLLALRSLYAKPSHAAALAAAHALRARLTELAQRRTIAARVFQADATLEDGLRAQLDSGSVPLVIADVPYGRRSSWLGAAAPPGAPAPAQTPPDPVYRLLGALRPVLLPNAIVAIAAAKRQPVQHERYRRVERLRVGARQVTLLTPAGGRA